MGNGDKGALPTTRARDWQEAFLAALRKRPSVAAAATAAGISRRNAYLARESDPAFAAEWDSVLQSAVDELEAVAFSRAADGSDAVMTFLLKCHRPQVYNPPDRREHSGPDGGPIALKVTLGKDGRGPSRNDDGSAG